MKSKTIKTHCSVCSRPIFDSVNPEKIITCVRCVQSLLMATQENKISYRNQLLEKEDTEGARSVESFIVPEEDTDVATFSTSVQKRGFNRLLRRSKGLLNTRRQPISNR